MEKGRKAAERIREIQGILEEWMLTHIPLPSGWQEPKPPKEPKTSEVETHFTIDGRHRYCKTRSTKKDRLVRDWSLVDCELCKTLREVVGN